MIDVLMDYGIGVATGVAMNADKEPFSWTTFAAVMIGFIAFVAAITTLRR